MGSVSRNSAATQSGLPESLDTYFDYNGYAVSAYQSPSLSPSSSIKTSFAPPIKTENYTPSLLPNQPLSGPSYDYNLHKQQTGIVPGALATTHALNLPNAHFHGLGDFSNPYYSMGTTDDFLDFNTSPKLGPVSSPELDLDFGSSPSDLYFVNPNVIGGQEPGSLPSPPPMPVSAPMSAVSSNAGRVYPGIHQQRALAEQQQRALAEQQHRQQALAQQAARAKRGSKIKSHATDPVVEQKISQLLKSQASGRHSRSPSRGPSVPKPKKDFEDMDEDERKLAGEEGKKMTGQARRQLRNKVSARAFRHRRKEYILQLEAEITGKVTDNNRLKAVNTALVDENKRLGDLSRMLLAAPAFSVFLAQLSAEQIAQAQIPHSVMPQQQQQQMQAQAQRQHKDVNPYAAQQIGMTGIPEQPLDLSVLGTEPMDGYTYQPNIFAVLETPEPKLDAATLAGKSTSFLTEQFDSSADEDKVDIPLIDRPVSSLPAKQTQESATVVVDEAFENDPAYALYHNSPAPAPKEAAAPVELNADGLLSHCLELFRGITPEKESAPVFELVDASEGDAAAARVKRLCDGLEGVRARLEGLTGDV